MERNVIILGADMSSSLLVDNKYKYLVILVEGPTQGLGDTILTSEAKDSINFTQANKWYMLISCECKCRFDARKCSSDQLWNNDKCRI